MGQLDSAWYSPADGRGELVLHAQDVAVQVDPFESKGLKPVLT
jgi:hypothetical protein